MRIPLPFLTGLLLTSLTVLSEASITFTPNPGGGIVMTISSQITIPLTASPQGVNDISTVYLNLEDVYSGPLTGGALTVTPGDYAGGFHASIDGIDATAYSVSGRRTNDSGIRDTTDFYVAFTFPIGIAAKGVGHNFVISPGSVVFTGANAPTLPDFEVTTAQLGGITGGTTLSNAVTVVPEPSAALLGVIGLCGLLRRRR